MKIKVIFKNGNKEEFDVDNHYISDNGFCLNLEKDNQRVGMVNLCELRYFKVEGEEQKTEINFEDGSYEII